MNFKALKDSRTEIPANAGNYFWFSKYMKTYIPVIWDGEHWHINRSIVDRETVRYWR